MSITERKNTLRRKPRDRKPLLTSSKKKFELTKKLSSPKVSNEQVLSDDGGPSIDLEPGHSCSNHYLIDHSSILNRKEHEYWRIF